MYTSELFLHLQLNPNVDTSLKSSRKIFNNTLHNQMGIHVDVIGYVFVIIAVVRILAEIFERLGYPGFLGEISAGLSSV